MSGRQAGLASWVQLKRSMDNWQECDASISSAFAHDSEWQREWKEGNGSARFHCIIVNCVKKGILGGIQPLILIESPLKCVSSSHCFWWGGAFLFRTKGFRIITGQAINFRFSFLLFPVSYAHASRSLTQLPCFVSGPPRSTSSYHNNLSSFNNVVESISLTPSTGRPFLWVPQKSG